MVTYIFTRSNKMTKKIIMLGVNPDFVQHIKTRKKIVITKYPLIDYQVGDLLQFQNNYDDIPFYAKIKNITKCNYFKILNCYLPLCKESTIEELETYIKDEGFENIDDLLNFHSTASEVKYYRIDPKHPSIEPNLITIEFE